MNSRFQAKKVESFHSFDELQKMSTSQNKSNNDTVSIEDSYTDYIYDKLQVGLEEDRVAVVIDGTNLYKLSRSIQNSMPDQSRFSIDYDILSKILHANFPNIKRKFFIISQTITKTSEDTNGYSAVRTLLDWLAFNGYTVISRDVVVDNSQGSDESPKSFYPSMDIEITTALFKAASIADRIVFFGSDRKWENPLKILRDEFNKNITVISATMPNKRRLVADELRKIDHFVDLNNSWFHDMFKRQGTHPRNFDGN